MQTIFLQVSLHLHSLSSYHRVRVSEESFANHKQTPFSNMTMYWNCSTVLLGWEEDWYWRTMDGFRTKFSIKSEVRNENMISNWAAAKLGWKLITIYNNTKFRNFSFSPTSSLPVNWEFHFPILSICIFLYIFFDSPLHFKQQKNMGEILMQIFLGVMQTRICTPQNLRVASTFKSIISRISSEFFMLRFDLKLVEDSIKLL
jgi:hypothetical protein